MVDVEQVPPCLKRGITIPVYKDGSKDPPDINSYRGITLNLVFSKVLESLILDRLEPLFMEAGLPHPNQSAKENMTSSMSTRADRRMHFFQLRACVLSIPEDTSSN